MLISCEKCSTTYVLDDALIPSQGAPVQCTRCGHVFTARLGASEPTPPPPARSATPAGTSTMMFGVPPAAASAPAAKNQTMMFGAPGSNAAPPPAPAPPPPSARSTMMFGSPASVPAPPPSAPPVSTKATMVFGAPSVAAPPAAKNQTMMFGTPASNAAGAAPPPAPAPSSKQTMVFGTAPSAKQPVVFGTAASNAAAASQPPPPATSSKQTMVFGGPAAAPVAAKNQTMMFGTAASNAIEPPGEETILEQPGQSSRTVLFGTAVPPPPEPAPSKNQTMMFGRAAIPKVTAGTVELAGYAADENQPAESTVRVDVQQVIEEHEEARAEAEEAAPEVHARHDRTQRFAMSDVGNTPPAGLTPVQDRHNRTQLFAMSSAQEATAPVGGALQAPSVLVGDNTLPPGVLPLLASRGSTDLNTTLPPDADLDPPGVSLLHDPANMTPPEAVPAAGPVATTLPNLPQMLERPMAPLALELPPEPMGSPQDLRAQHHHQQQDLEDAAAMRAVRGGGGAGKAVIVILVIVALALAGVLVYRLFGRQLLGKAAPVEALRSTEQALATLRFDDLASQEKAVTQLTAVLAEHPGLPETQAALVIASALRFDDVQGQLTRATVSLRSLKSNDAPTERLTAVEAKIAASEASAKALKGQLESALARLHALLPGVETGTPTHLALLRADGLARGILGDGEALTRAEAFRQRSPAPDDWVDLIEPEYALNGGSSLDEAITQLIALKGRGSNSTFLRPYVLLARLQLKKGEKERARAELEQVSTMNSGHEIARELLASLAAP